MRTALHGEKKARARSALLPLLGFARGTFAAVACAAWVSIAGASIVACGPGEVKAPNPTRPLAESRAIEVIRRAVKNEGAEPAAGRDEILQNGKTIHVDVGIAGRAFGIAYISQEDADALGAAIPGPNKKDEKLKLVRAGQDGETRIVLLFQQNYLYDDQLGEAHEQTTITAESSLARDVQDFVTYARAQKFK
jgi:hypothetical protein